MYAGDTSTAGHVVIGCEAVLIGLTSLVFVLMILYSTFFATLLLPAAPWPHLPTPLILHRLLGPRLAGTQRIHPRQNHAVWKEKVAQLCADCRKRPFACRSDCRDYSCDRIAD